MNFVLAERELTDILLNHSVGFDRDLDLRILEFYSASPTPSSARWTSACK